MSENGTTGVKLTANQTRAIAALLTTASVGKAAKKCGLASRTLHRYLSSEDFRRELRARQDETVAATVAALSGLSGKATETLDAVMGSKDAAEGVKVRAAQVILQERRKASELDDLAERVSKLEEQQITGG